MKKQNNYSGASSQNSGVRMKIKPQKWQRGEKRGEEA